MDNAFYQTLVTNLVIFLAGVGGGAVNSIAGGGTNFTFPALLWMGVDPILASSTSTVCLWPGQLLGGLAYRRTIAESPRHWLWLGIPAALGGFLGGWLLLRTPARLFDCLVPYLVLSGSVLLAIEPWLRARLGIEMRTDSSLTVKICTYLAITAVAVYGGYFGAGMGILMLAALSFIGIGDIQRANAFKNIFASLLNLLAIIYFIYVDAIVWHAALYMILGACLGGYFGGKLAGRIPAKTLRFLMAALGLIIGTYLFLK